MYIRCFVIFIFCVCMFEKGTSFFANKFKNCMFEKNMTHHIRNTQNHFMYICRTFISKD